MSEALAAILDYGFSVLKLSKVTADTDLDNSRSRRLLERLGFHLDKVQEDGRYYSLDVNSRGIPVP